MDRIVAAKVFVTIAECGSLSGAALRRIVVRNPSGFKVGNPSSKRCSLRSRKAWHNSPIWSRR